MCLCQKGTKSPAKFLNLTSLFTKYHDDAKIVTFVCFSFPICDEQFNRSSSFRGKFQRDGWCYSTGSQFGWIHLQRTLQHFHAILVKPLAKEWEWDSSLAIWLRFPRRLNFQLDGTCHRSGHHSFSKSRRLCWYLHRESCLQSFHSSSRRMRHQKRLPFISKRWNWI